MEFGIVRLIGIFVVGKLALTVGLTILSLQLEIETRCNLVIEFIIPKFVEGSTCFERHTAHHQEL
jgi:hypothetical protein